jgi:membrane protein implicated in regulation of membrane protease activity
MLPLYLFCLIVGGGLLLFSLFGGTDHDADTGHVSHDADHPDTVDVHSGLDIAKEFLSVRSLFYFLAGFGATGALLEATTDAASAAALVWAIATGMTAALAAGLIYGWLRRSQSGFVPRDSDYLVGLPAQVVLPVTAGHRGKVRTISAGREIELLAKLHGAGDEDCPRGMTVVIVDIDGDTALVAPAAALPSELV